MSTVTRRRPVPVPGDLRYAKIVEYVTIPNTGRRAAARQAALVPIVAAYGAELQVGDPSNIFNEWARPDANGDRTCLLRGERTLVDLLARQIIPGTIERMESAAADAMKLYNAHLRADGVHVGDRPFMRRRFRDAFLRYWGWAFAERARAYQSAHGPWEPEWFGKVPDRLEGAAPDAWDEARRAVQGLDAFDVFGRGVAAHARAAREAIAAFERACAAAGTTPDEVLCAEYDARNDHIRGPIELGEIEPDEQAGRARLIIGIGNVSGRAAARVTVIHPILRALGAWAEPPRPADRWGQLVLTPVASEPVIRLIHDRIAVILERAESSVRSALRDILTPYQKEFADARFIQRDRETWWNEYLRGWGNAFAERLNAARDGRTAAARNPRQDPETLGTVPTRDREGRRLPIEEYGAAYGAAHVDLLDPAEFCTLAAELGGTVLLGGTAFEQVPAETAEDIDPEAAESVRIPDADGHAAARLDALAPLLAVYQVRVTRAGVDYNRWGGDVHTHLRASVRGPAHLAGPAVRSAAMLLPVMERAAARAARRAGLDGAEAAAYADAFRLGWGAAYAARITAALAGDLEGRADLPAEPGPGYLAALEVDDLETAPIMEEAARIAAVTDPAGLPEQCTVVLAFDPGPSGYPSYHRAHEVRMLAQVYGLSARNAGQLDTSVPIDEQRELLAVTGPAPLVRVFTATAGALIAEADALISRLLPQVERRLDGLAATRRDASARRSRRVEFTAGLLREYLRAFGERLADHLAGRPDRPRRTAGDEVDERAAYGAVYALEAARLAPDAAAITGARAALLDAFRARHTRDRGPRRRVVIVPCGRAKQTAAAEAGRMYVGTYFGAAMRAARTVAEDDGADVMIFSALYGLVDPRAVIEPYELTLGQPGAIVPAQLRRQAAALGLAGAEVTVFGGARYTKMVQAVWPDAAAPLAGAGGIGHQMQRLSRIASGARPARNDEEPER